MYDSPDPWGVATEVEWPSVAHPAPLLEVIRGRTSERKPRLFSCACCRRVWDMLSELERNATHTAERYADGQASEDERWDCLGTLMESVGAEVHQEVGGGWWAVADRFVIPNGVIALLSDTEALVCRLTGRCIRGTGVADGAYRAIFSADISAQFVEQRLPPALVVQDRWFGRMWQTTLRRLTGSPSPLERERATLLAREWSYQADLVREIFGNPFRPVAFSPEWQTSTAIALAQQMYESRDFSAMPILADALQDAGCDNDDILNHCRDANGVHVRGCWVVDLVLGKS